MAATSHRHANSSLGNGKNRRKRARRGWLVFGGTALLLVGFAGLLAWLGSKASAVNAELTAATGLVSQLRDNVAADDSASAANTVGEIRRHTAEAKEAVGDPVWSVASSIPLLGNNFNAISEIARSADDVAALGLTPLVRVLDTLDWEDLLPNAEGTDLRPLKAAAPSVSSAANAVRLSADRLDRIEADMLLPQVAQPLSSAREQLQEASVALSAASSVADLAPSMLGSDAARSYLLIVQNNAEVRASGGIPGALAVINLDQGKLTLGSQSSAGEIGVMAPPLGVDPTQEAIYSGRLGKFMQDVNLTPDFPTAASTAQAMWERKSGQRVDGVISIDPVALSYVLDATGPIKLRDSQLVTLARDQLPTQLTSENVVQTLLSDVYTKIEQPNLQDAYFAGVAQEVFSALSTGKADQKALLQGFVKGADEGRLRLWSGNDSEQSSIAKYPLAGAVLGASVQPAEFGVYFNDGTGAKMDYYVKRTVQLVRECASDGYEQTTVRVTSTNTAPADAATSLPPYVTGGGDYGVPAGSVQTNVVAYGPAQAHIETVTVDGQKSAFAPYFHGNRPVGIYTVRLSPGESKTVSYSFGKIVQHTDPQLVVTPTVQSVNDIRLPTEFATCG